MTISPARLFLTRELHRFFMLQVLTWWTSLQTPSQPAGVTLQRVQLPQWLRDQAEKWSRLLSHWTATHWDRWSLLTNRGCVSWTTQEPCLSSACQFHALFSAAPEMISAMQESGKEQGTFAPCVCHTAEHSFSAEGRLWWLRTQSNDDINPCGLFLLHLVIQSIVSNLI